MIDDQYPPGAWKQHFAKMPNGEQSYQIVLPWPPATLSGHNNGHWRGKSAIVAKHRAWAFQATKAARPSVPAKGDILVTVDFYPPDNRSDRLNFPNRMKPYFDGIAEALGVNDKRFLPAFNFYAPVEGGKVIVQI